MNGKSRALDLGKGIQFISDVNNTKTQKVDDANLPISNRFFCACDKEVIPVALLYYHHVLFW